MLRRVFSGAIGVTLALGLMVAISAPAEAARVKVPASSLLKKLRVAPESNSRSYNRRAFDHWSPRGDSCDVRGLVLIKTSSIKARTSRNCDVLRGKWRDEYSKRTVRNPRRVYVDHRVPLAEAWRSGASRWTDARRRGFANDTTYAPSLAAVSARSKRAKADRDPSGWLPTRGTCAYVAKWVAVKYRWNLTVDRAERKTLKHRLARCGKSRTKVVKPTKGKAENSKRAAPSPSPSPGPSPSPVPSPSPTVPPVVSPKPVDPVASGVGSVPVGSTSYPVPAGAIFVSPAGVDTASGVKGAPYRTLAKAIAKAPTGATIVLREGSYHESVTVPREKSLTIQAYPKEAVYLDGSSVVSGFVKSGAAWVKSGWATSFDRSPTYGRGKPDNAAVGWRWVSEAFPYAAWPDQVWIDGVALTQVGSAAQVKAGTFFVDYGAGKLYVGSDPTNKNVRASDLSTAMTLMGSKSVLRGIGITRYAPSVPDMGTLRLFGPNLTVENVEVTENATGGVTAYSSGITLRNVTTARNGQIGMHAHQSDNLTYESVLVEGNNRERFNPAPSAAGLKVTGSRNVVVKDSVFRDNWATGIWFDESVYNATVTGNDSVRNFRHGIVFELSGKATIANNVVGDNAETGLLILDAADAKIWNNSIWGSLLPVRISDGKRVATDLSTAGHDKRQKLPDPTVTWITRNIEFKNNVVGAIRVGDNWCSLVCVRDEQKKVTGQQMNVTMDGNLYHRTSASVPSAVIRWSGGTEGPIAYKKVADFAKATGHGTASAEVISTSPVLTSGLLKTSVSARGVAVPSAIANLTGLTAGAKTVGPQAR